MRRGTRRVPVLQDVEANATGLDPEAVHCAHRPGDVPAEWDGWVLHGHHHNNDTETYPFVAHDRRHVNVSSELLNFRPLRLDALTQLLEACPDGSRFRDVDAAGDYLGRGH